LAGLQNCLIIMTNTQIRKNIPVNIKMTLISKDIKVEKICTNEHECFLFERDMPAKHGLLFSSKEYIIGRTNLNFNN